MKNIIAVAMLLCAALSTSAQEVVPNRPVTAVPEAGTYVPEEPYVGGAINEFREYTPRQPYTNPDIVVTEPGDKVLLKTTYMDGLGREAQVVDRMSSEDGHDMVLPKAYDHFGRETVSYLPYADLPRSLRPGSFRVDALTAQSLFYRNADPETPQSVQPYAESIYEANPMGRLLRQGSAGTDWAVLGDHALQHTYRYNLAGEVPLFHYDDLFERVRQDSGAYYPPNRLRVTQTIDEDKHVTEEFTDLSGLPVMRRTLADDSTWATTIYVYDDLEQLMAVLPPAFMEVYDPTASMYDLEQWLNTFAYRYRYDSRGYLISKSLPGKDDWEYIVYNSRRLPVLSQTPAQRTDKQWSFAKFDALNRVVMTGTVTIDLPMDSIRAEAARPQAETGRYDYEFRTTVTGIGWSYAASYPTQVTIDDIETLVYYDDYTIPCIGEFSFMPRNGFDQAFKAYPTGQITALIAKDLSTGEHLYRVFYFDDKLRPVQTLEQHAYADTPIGGYTVSSYAYDWAGNLIRHSEEFVGAKTLVQHKRMSYDHTGRLLQTWHRVEADGYSPVVWTDLQHAAALGTQIVKIADENYSSATFDAGGLSSRTIPAGENASVRFTAGAEGADFRRMFGLDEGDFTYHMQSLSHGIYLSLQDIRLIDNGVTGSVIGTWQPGDVFEIERKDGRVYYRQNGQVLMESATPATGSLRAAAAFRFANHYFERIDFRGKASEPSEEVLLASVDYNTLGQLVNKKLHSRDQGQTFLQDTDYRYNIRGWLEQVNDPSSGIDDPKKVLNFAFAFNRGFVQPAYNGSVSGMRWKIFGNEERAYGFGYDAMNRLTKADYIARAEDGTWTGQADQYSTSVAYDLYGNITRLTRNGLTGEGTAGTIDDLEYTYKGSRLKNIRDWSDELDGYTDNAFFKATGVEEYHYDQEGRMTDAWDKDIRRIEYNQLNMPASITYNDGRRVVHQYTGDGAKQRTQYYLNDILQNTTSYIGAVMTENGEPVHLVHGEGFLRADEYTGTGWRYTYDLTDHLGNTWVTIAENDPLDYLCTFETALDEEETYEFGDSRSAGEIKAYAAHNHTPDGDKSQQLRGYEYNEAVGVAKSLEVYPGDTVDMEVYASFVDYTGADPKPSPLSFGAMFLQAFGIPYGGETGINADSYNAFAIGDGASATSSDYVPAYLNYVLFDADMAYYDGGFVQLPAAGGASPERLALSIPIDIQGYIFIYVSNESQEALAVYFDDFKVTHTPGIIIQSESYYPFGLTFDGFRRGDLDYKGTVGNTGSGFRDLGFRDYEPATGRFYMTDPLAELQQAYSPYHYALNNPIRNIDALGLTGMDGVNRVQLITGDDNSGDSESRGDTRGMDKPQVRKPRYNAKQHDINWDYHKPTVVEKTTSSDNSGSGNSNGTTKSDGTGKSDGTAKSDRTGKSDGTAQAGGAKTGSQDDGKNENPLPMWNSWAYYRGNQANKLITGGFSTNNPTSPVAGNSTFKPNSHTPVTSSKAVGGANKPPSVYGNRWQRSPRNPIPWTDGMQGAKNHSAYVSGASVQQRIAITALAYDQQAPQTNKTSLPSEQGSRVFEEKGDTDSKNRVDRSSIFGSANGIKVDTNKDGVFASLDKLSFTPTYADSEKIILQNVKTTASGVVNTGLPDEDFLINVAIAKLQEYVTSQFKDGRTLPKDQFLFNVNAKANEIQAEVNQIATALDPESTILDFTGISDEERAGLERGINKYAARGISSRVTIVKHEQFEAIKARLLEENYEPANDVDILISEDKNGYPLKHIFFRGGFYEIAPEGVNTKTGERFQTKGTELEVQELVQKYGDSALEYDRLLATPLEVPEKLPIKDEFGNIIEIPENQKGLSSFEKVMLVVETAKVIIDDLSIGRKIWDENSPDYDPRYFNVPDPLAGGGNAALDKLNNIKETVGMAMTAFDKKALEQIWQALKQVDMDGVISMIGSQLSDVKDNPLYHGTYLIAEYGIDFALATATGGLAAISAVEKIISWIKRFQKLSKLLWDRFVNLVSETFLGRLKKYVNGTGASNKEFSEYLSNKLKEKPELATSIEVLVEGGLEDAIIKNPKLIERLGEDMLDPKFSDWIKENPGMVDSWKVVDDISPSNATDVATLQKLSDDIALEPSFATWIKDNPQHFDAWKNWEATYRSLGDPVKDILGSGRLSHTDEWNRLIREIEDAGGEVKFSPGRIAYSPGVTKGSPGQLIIDQDASITALRHEHRHFIDDQAVGYLGFEGVYDINFRVTTEYNAYKLEVQEMINIGENTVANQLKQNFLDEVTSIKDHLNLPITPELQSLVDDLMGL